MSPTGCRNTIVNNQHDLRQLVIIHLQWTQSCFFGVSWRGWEVPRRPGHEQGGIPMQCNWGDFLKVEGQWNSLEEQCKCIDGNKSFVIEPGGGGPQGPQCVRWITDKDKKGTESLSCSLQLMQKSRLTNTPPAVFEPWDKITPCDLMQSGRHRQQRRGGNSTNCCHRAHSLSAAVAVAKEQKKILLLESSLDSVF